MARRYEKYTPTRARTFWVLLNNGFLAIRFIDQRLGFNLSDLH
jgi:hypothetical protein